MKKVLIWGIAVMLMVAMTFIGVGCKEEAAPVEEAVVEEVVVEEVEEEAIKPLDEMKIGYVMPYLEGWFYYWDIGWKIIMDHHGVETETILTYWEPEKELQAVRDFITMEVDALSIESGNADTAQVMCQLANEAGIPILIDSSSISEGPGKPFFDISFDYGAMGTLMGEKISENWPGSKVLHMAGIAGFLATDAQDDALKAVAEDTGAYELVGTEYTGYSMEETMTLLRDIIQSGKEFDIVIGSCQEISEGIIETLKSEGLLGEKIVISVNYGPLDVINLDEKELDFAVGQSVGLHSMVAGVVVLNYLQGIEPFAEVANLPFQWCTQDNHKEVGISWEVDESWIPVAEKYALKGELDY